MKNYTIDPWEVKGDIDYEKLSREFGVKKFSNILKQIPEPNTYMRRNIIYAHRDFEKILNRIKNKQPFIMMTGLMPSGKFHLGHKMVADQMIYYQEHGAKLYICVADIEAYNTRHIPLEELKQTAINEYLLNYIALGLKPKNVDFYFQSNRHKNSEKSNAYYRLTSKVSRYTTLNEMKAIYGTLTPGKIISIMHQISDILHPQLKEFEGKMPTIVPVGFDQDPHIRLTRDIASRMKDIDIITPSSTYHKFMMGLKGGKMSSSDPNSYIALTDTPEEAKKKILKYAFSGGQPTLEEHRKYGGNPDIDVSFNLLKYMFEEDDKKLKKIEEEYRSGKLLTGELKQITIEKISRFLENHHKKLEKARSKIDKFL